VLPDRSLVEIVKELDSLWMPPPSPTAVLPDTVLADTVARTRSRWIPPPPCRKPVAVAADREAGCARPGDGEILVGQDLTTGERDHGAYQRRCELDRVTGSRVDHRLAQ